MQAEIYILICFFHSQSWKFFQLLINDTFNSPSCVSGSTYKVAQCPRQKALVAFLKHFTISESLLKWNTGLKINLEKLCLQLTDNWDTTTWAWLLCLYFYCGIYAQMAETTSLITVVLREINIYFNLVRKSPI